MDTDVVVGMALIVYETDPVDPEYPVPVVGVNTALIESVPTGSDEVVQPDPVIGFPTGDELTSICTDPVAAGGLIAIENPIEVPTY